MASDFRPILDLPDLPHGLSLGGRIAWNAPQSFATALFRMTCAKRRWTNEIFVTPRRTGKIAMRVNVLFQMSTFLLFAFGSLVAAQASPMVYTEQATGSGRLGESSFTNALVTVTFVGDTDDVRFRHVSPIPGPIPFLSVSLAPATVNVSGIGTATITNSIEVACLPIAFGPFVPEATIGGILGTISLALEGYGLKTPIGPITGSADFRIGAPVLTTLGPFSWDEI